MAADGVRVSATVVAAVAPRTVGLLEYCEAIIRALIDHARVAREQTEAVAARVGAAGAGASHFMVIGERLMDRTSVFRAPVAGVSHMDEARVVLACLRVTGRGFAQLKM